MGQLPPSEQSIHSIFMHMQPILSELFDDSLHSRVHNVGHAHGTVYPIVLPKQLLLNNRIDKMQ